MCGCSHTLLSIFWLRTEGQVCTLLRVLHCPRGDSGRPSSHCTLQGRGERSEEVERNDYLDLHLRSWETARKEKKKKKLWLGFEGKKNNKKCFCSF